MRKYLHKNLLLDLKSDINWAMGYIEEIERRKQQEAKRVLDAQAEIARQQQLAEEKAAEGIKRREEERLRNGREVIEDAHKISAILDEFRKLGYPDYLRCVAEITSFALRGVFYRRHEWLYESEGDEIYRRYGNLDKVSDLTKEQDHAVKVYYPQYHKTHPIHWWQGPDLWEADWLTPDKMFFGDVIVAPAEGGKLSTKQPVKGLREAGEVGIGIRFLKHIKEIEHRSRLAELFKERYDYLTENWSHAVYIRIIPPRERQLGELAPTPPYATITGAVQQKVDLRDRRLFDRTLEQAINNPAVVYASRRDTWSQPSPPSGDYRGSGQEGPCLPGFVPINTPIGLIPVKNLKVGDAVWTVDKFGNKITAVITKRSKVLVKSNHKMLHIVFSDGRKLPISPGHPGIDGKPLSELIVGKVLDGAMVVSACIIPYRERYTYDILPSGDTGGYWANNILIGSTLSGQFLKQVQWYHHSLPFTMVY